MIECGSCSVKPIDFLFIWWGRNEGLNIIEMSFNFYQRTTTTHTTLQVSQSFFDLVVTEISARVEITIQSLAATGYRAYELNCPESFEEHPSTQELVQGSWLLFFQIFYLKLPTDSNSCQWKLRNINFVADALS